MPEKYTPSPDLLAGRVILVTGAGDGIGRAAALACARHGASMVLLGRTLGKLEQVYDEIERQGGATPALLPFDLATLPLEAYEQVSERLEKEFGRLDGLLHNAAELGTLTPVELYDPGIWHQVIQVNLNAAWMLTRACLPLLKRAADASIVFTTADVGRKGRAYWGAYGAACFALEGLAQILADELVVNTAVRVNSLDPGAVRTHMRRRAYPGVNPQRWPDPEEIMETYLYLLGPDSRGITGKAFNAQAA